MTRAAAAAAVIAIAACGKAAPPPPVHLVFGDATLSTIAEPPVTELQLHPDGSVQLRNERTGQTMDGTYVKADGLVFMSGQPLFEIRDQDITNLASHAVVATIAGNALAVGSGSARADVVLGDDDVIRVRGRDTWKITAADPQVARAAFLIYATVMKP